MFILSIETSCDESALSLVQTTNKESQPQFKVIHDMVISQIEIHAEYGGVFPALAKREHAKNLPVLLEYILKNSPELSYIENKQTDDQIASLNILLEREPGLCDALIAINETYGKPNIQCIMVTYGPGLAPALWVGINVARALSLLWDIPILPVNHMEGHITSVLLKDDYATANQALYPVNDFPFPMISLLISGGHTQIILIKDWCDYEILGETIDDAIGEAFDKVARMLNMPYPGGPKVSEAARKGEFNELVKFPRPMLHSGDFRFSFSGLKTSVRYLIEDLKSKNLMDEQMTADIAREFEYAVNEVLIKKTFSSIDKHNAKGLIIAGGVSANTFIIKNFRDKCQEYGIRLYTPEKKMCGDNSLMIATAGVVNFWKKGIEAYVSRDDVSAVGNLKL